MKKTATPTLLTCDYFGVQGSCGDTSFPREIRASMIGGSLRRCVAEMRLFFSFPTPDKVGDICTTPSKNLALRLVTSWSGCCCCSADSTVCHVFHVFRPVFGSRNRRRKASHVNYQRCGACSVRRFWSSGALDIEFVMCWPLWGKVALQTPRQCVPKRYGSLFLWSQHEEFTVIDLRDRAVGRAELDALKKARYRKNAEISCRCLSDKICVFYQEDTVVNREGDWWRISATRIRTRICRKWRWMGWRSRHNQVRNRRREKRDRDLQKRWGESKSWMQTCLRGACDTCATPNRQSRMDVYRYCGLDESAAQIWWRRHDHSQCEEWVPSLIRRRQWHTESNQREWLITTNERERLSEDCHVVDDVTRVWKLGSMTLRSMSSCCICVFIRMFSTVIRIKCCSTCVVFWM